MRKHHLKPLAIALIACAGSSLVACQNGTNSNSSNPTPANSVQEVHLPDNGQTRTPASINTRYHLTDAVEHSLHASALTAGTNNCLAIVAQASGKNYSVSINPSEWWSTAGITFSLKNTCSTAQAFTNLPITISSVQMNGTGLSSLGDLAQQGKWLTASTKLSGTDVLVSLSTSACDGDYCDWAKLAPGATNTFTLNLSLGSAIKTLTVNDITIGGQVPPPAPLPGKLQLVIAAPTELQTLCKSTSCAIKVNLSDPAGNLLPSPVIFNPAIEAAKTVVYSNILPGNYTMAVDSSTLPKGVSPSYTPANAIVAVNENSQSNSQVNFTYTAPAELGSLQLNLANLSDAAKFATISNINGVITDIDVTPNKAYPFSIKLNNHYTMDNLPAKHHYKISLNGIGNAQLNAYYAPISSSSQIMSPNQATLVNLSYVRATNTQTTTFVTSGDPVPSQGVKFADDNNYQYASDNSIVNGSSYTFISSNTTNIDTAAPTNYSLQLTPKVISNGVSQVTVTYTKQTTPVYAGFYDFAMPTTSGSGIDYSGSFKVVFTPNSATRVNQLEFVSNVANLDQLILNYGNFWGWGVNPVWHKTTDTLTGGTRYKLSFLDNNNQAVTVALESGKVLNFTWHPDQQGVKFEKVAPIISNVTINQQAYGIAGACSNCTDPGAGKRIIGYQEQWSVYGREYAPEQIPFTKLNTINYAFIDFASPKSYPFSGNGKYGILSADGGADYRQLVALWKAKQRYPYLKVVLSFGGWTNDNETTSPDINFNQMSDAQQHAFAKEAAAIVKAIGFDGVDIDWEWWANHRTTNQDACAAGKTVRPGAPYCLGTPVKHDTQKYINLLKYLRSELGNDKLLTVATVSAKDKILSDEDPSVGGVIGAWKQIAAQVDYINVMAYDMHGAFDYPNATNSQAPWDIDSKNDPYYGKPGGVTIKSSLQTYIDKGVPAAKLVLGVPAYGRSSSITEAGTKGGLYQAITATPKGEFDATGIFSYKCLTQGDCHGGGSQPQVTFYPHGSELYNSYGTAALTPWAASSNMYITYDDQTSVQAKFQHACSTFGSLGGGMVWALDGDTTDNTSIVSAIMNNIHCQ